MKIDLIQLFHSQLTAICPQYIFKRRVHTASDSLMIFPVVETIQLYDGTTYLGELVGINTAQGITINNLQLKDTWELDEVISLLIRHVDRLVEKHNEPNN